MSLAYNQVNCTELEPQKIILDGATYRPPLVEMLPFTLKPLITNLLSHKGMRFGHWGVSRQGLCWEAKTEAAGNKMIFQ